MKKIIIFITFLWVFTVSLTAQGAEPGEQVSVYSIGDGALIASFDPSSTSNPYLYSNTAYFINKANLGNVANWLITYLKNGKMMLKNLSSNKCMEFYGEDYRLTENACNLEETKQQITPRIKSTGAIQLVFEKLGSMGEDLCVYSYAGIENFYPYTNGCQNKKNYLWSIVPQFSDAD